MKDSVTQVLKQLESTFGTFRWWPKHKIVVTGRIQAKGCLNTLSKPFNCLGATTGGRQWPRKQRSTFGLSFHPRSVLFPCLLNQRRAPAPMGLSFFLGPGGWQNGSGKWWRLVASPTHSKSAHLPNSHYLGPILWAGPAQAFLSFYDGGSSFSMDLPLVCTDNAAWARLKHLLHKTDGRKLGLALYFG